MCRSVLRAPVLSRVHPLQLARPMGVARGGIDCDAGLTMAACVLSRQDRSFAGANYPYRWGG